MSINWLAELFKIVPILLAALLTAWLSDYYFRRRRRELYREHLFKERLRVYCELWQRYVSVSRLLGTKGDSSTAEQLQRDILNRAPITAAGSTESRAKAKEILDSLESFVTYARGVYVILDPATLEALEQIIMLLEGKTGVDHLMIDWGELHRRSLALRYGIRRELGIDELREIDDIIGRGQPRQTRS